MFTKAVGRLIGSVAQNNQPCVSMLLHTYILSCKTWWLSF